MSHKLRTALALVLLLLAFSTAAHADRRYIVRDTLGLGALNLTCALLGCNVVGGLDGALGQLFLVTTADSVNPVLFINLLLGQLGVTHVELDQVASLRQSAASAGPPPALYDRAPVSYFGTTVWNGYVNQPASQIVRLAEARSAFGVDGARIVAVIDTGVDPDHPALAAVLVPGYDFVRNKSGTPNEKADVNQSTAAVLDGAGPVIVNQSTAAVLDQSTAAVLDNPQYAAFGHGTMVAGVIHLVAPRASIMPLKAFRSDGSGYLADILRAMYYAVPRGAKVIHMSFSMFEYSKELDRAAAHARNKGAVLVASVGNEGQNTTVYPAGLNAVIGVAATSNQDQRSTFSNYGPMVWMAAPGEAIVTTYPYGTYAAAWGTSFSAPFVSGAVALLLDVRSCTSAQAAAALANAQQLSPDLGHGRLDVYRAVQAWLE